MSQHRYKLTVERLLAVCPCFTLLYLITGLLIKPHVPSPSTDLLVVLFFRQEAVVNGLKSQVDMREIVKPVSPPGRNVIHPSRRHPCSEKKFGCSLN